VNGTHANQPLPSLRFEKMHGLGNDFMLVDARLQRLDLSPAVIRHWANRRTGVGFDQLILLSDTPECDYVAAYRFYNADGSEAEQCGNGQRCLGRYLWQSGWAGDHRFQVIGPGGPVSITVHTPDDVEISLPGPDCRLFDQLYAEVSVGNPHRVQWVESQEALETLDLAQLAESVRRHYPQGINLEVVHVRGPDHLQIRVHERGTGETRACGSGAAAAAVASVQRQLGGGEHRAIRPDTSHRLRVDMPGGQLLVNYQPGTGRLSLRGPAAHVYQGRVFYPAPDNSQGAP